MPFRYEPRKVYRDEEILVGANCDGCGQELEPILVNDEGGCGYGFTAALRISISGGYGEYIDGGGSAILCRTCASKLEEVQLLAAAFREARD